MIVPKGDPRRFRDVDHADRARLRLGRQNACRDRERRVKPRRQAAGSLGCIGLFDRVPTVAGSSLLLGSLRAAGLRLRVAGRQFASLGQGGLGGGGIPQQPAGGRQESVALLGRLPANRLLSEPARLREPCPPAGRTGPAWRRRRPLPVGRRWPVSESLRPRRALQAARRPWPG